MKIVQTPGPIDYWIIQTLLVDANGMVLRPEVNGGLYNLIATLSSQFRIFGEIEKFGGKVTGQNRIFQT